MGKRDGGKERLGRMSLDNMEKRLSVEKRASVDKRSSKRASKRNKMVKADTFSHLMHIGTRDYESGKLEARPITTMGYLMFKEKVTMEQLKKIVYDKLVSQIFRYHAVPQERQGATYFVDVGAIDDAYHFQHVSRRLESEAEWQAFLQGLVEQGLDLSKPWWRYILVDEMPDGRCAVVAMVDHTHGDGASSVSALLSMVENKSLHNPVFQSKSIVSEPAGEPEPEQALQKKKKNKGRALNAYERMVAFAQGAVSPVLEQVLPNDAVTKLKQPTGVFPKKWNFSMTPAGGELDVAKVKEIKNRIPGATVNDVMLALTALSIKEYYKKINEPIMKTSKDIRGTLAVNARPAGVDYLSDQWFGNHIVIATMRYPLHESRVDTVCSFRDQSRMLKASPDVIVRNFLMKAMSMLPRDKVVKIAAEASVKFSIMISNVCFSLEPLEMFGQVVDDVRFIACSPLGCYVGAATYVDKISFGVVTTEDTGADPSEILPFFKEECDKLYQEVTAMDPKELQRKDKPKKPPAELLAGAGALLTLVLLVVLKALLM